MLGSPLLESYRRELRREQTARWARRGAIAAGVLAVLGLGYAYHRSRGTPEGQSGLQPLIPSHDELERRAAEATPLDGGASADARGEPPLPRATERLTPAQTHGTGELGANQALIDALAAHGLQRSESEDAARALATVLDPRKLRPGQRYEFWRTTDGRLDRLLLYRTALRYVEVVADGGTFSAREREAETQVEPVRVAGVIETSLGAALVRAGESSRLALLFRDFFADEIDFRSDVRKKDQFRLIVEKVMVGDRFVKYGRILAAEYRGHKGRRRGYAYTNPDGRTGVFDDNGQSRRRVFLRSPVPGARITSRFSMRRLHPIYKKYRPHLGVDYAAPTGRAVLSVADGRVVFAGRKAANGLLLVIRHDGGYKSHYAHLHALAKGVRAGVEVRQGQVVAQVGNTGLSTGPHLHFGLSRDGRYQDPEKVGPVRAESVPAEHMNHFLSVIAPLARDLDHMALQDETLFGDLVLPP